MKFTYTAKVSAKQLPELKSIPNGVPFKHQETTLMKIGIGGLFLNSKMISDNIENNKFFCINLTTGMMVVIDGDSPVDLIKYQFIVESNK